MVKPTVPQYGRLSARDYTAKINSPSRSPEYFVRFHAPLIEAVKARVAPDRKVRLLDVACGHGDELAFFATDPRVHIIGVDVSRETIEHSTRVRFSTAELILADVSDIPKGGIVVPNSVHVGIAVNAVVYKPYDILAALYYALQPGAKCAVNFRVFENPRNRPFYDYYVADGKGGVLSDQEVVFKAGSKSFVLKVLDYNGFVDPQIRSLDRQVYFQDVVDIVRLIELAGFRAISREPFRFASPANPDNEIDVFTIQK